MKFLDLEAIFPIPKKSPKGFVTPNTRPMSFAVSSVQGNARAWPSRRSPNLAINSECLVDRFSKCLKLQKLAFISKKWNYKTFEHTNNSKSRKQLKLTDHITLWYFLCVLLSCVWIAKPVCKKTMVSVRSLHFDFRKWFKPKILKNAHDFPT